jgi:hypothetical protein
VQTEYGPGFHCETCNIPVPVKNYFPVAARRDVPDDLSEL